jgi:hypothetical protein
VTRSSRTAKRWALVLAWFTWSVTALAVGQPVRAVSVRTHDGVAFTLPASFREQPLPPQPSAQSAELERAYVDGGSPPVQLFISHDSARPGRSLPPPSEQVAKDYTAGFVAGVQRTVKLTQILDVTQSAYDPEHAAFSLTMRARTGDAIASIASVAFFTRSAVVQVLIVARNTREADVRAFAAQVVSTSQVSPESKLEVSIFHDVEDMSAFTLGRLLGALIGPVFVVVLLGGLLAWLLTRVGTAPKLAAIAGCAATALIYVIGAVWSGDQSTFRIVQVVSSLSASALLVLPINKWLRAR